MKPTNSHYHYLILLFSSLVLYVCDIVAGPIGTAFTYQGRLASGSNAANGLYDFSFALFDDASVGTQKGPTLTPNAVPVSNGLFAVTLDFGNVFDGEARWLAITVKTNGAGTYTPLTPRQSLTPAPHAVFASSLSSDVNQMFTGTVTFDPVSGPPFAVGSAALVENLNADLLDGLHGWEFWKLTGNAGTSPGVNFLGTTDNQALELKVYGQRALRLEPTTGAPNFIAGSGNNSVSVGCFGAAIGGGATNVVNSPWASSFGAIGGGAGNTVGHQYGTIGGGSRNSAGDLCATIGGGLGNRIVNSEYGSEYATVGGGAWNTIYSTFGTIGGGESNFCGSAWAYGTIGGGFANNNGGSYGTIGGGKGNSIREPLVPQQPGATIAGGESNLINAAYGSIGGGLGNAVSNSFGTIGGGQWNLVGADNSTVAGGSSNTVDELSSYSAIGGGGSNAIHANPIMHAGNRACTISGGFQNVIWCGPDFLSSYVAIGGGNNNSVSENSDQATIAGGGGNKLCGNGAAIGGGTQNLIQGIGSVGSPGSVIAGGKGNTVAANTSFGTVSGGSSNKIQGTYGTIPGGFSNSASTYAFAAGRRAKANHQGAFVWADSMDADFASTANNQFLIRASGGVGIGTGTPVAQLDVRGNASFGNVPFSLTSLNARNVLNLQVGTNANGWANGISFCEDAEGWGMKLGYDGTGTGTENKMVIYDVNDSPRFVFEGGGNLGLGVFDPSNPIEHSSGAVLTASGVWQNASDASRKTGFSAVDPREVLANLARMPVQSWRYTNEVSSVRHLGPTAQDFKAAFNLGTDDKSIGTIDADGVALAAIQGLNEVVKEKDARIRALEADVAELKALVSQLSSKVSGGGQ